MDVHNSAFKQCLALTVQLSLVKFTGFSTSVDCFSLFLNTGGFCLIYIFLLIFTFVFVLSLQGRVRVTWSSVIQHSKMYKSCFSIGCAILMQIMGAQNHCFLLLHKYCGNSYECQSQLKLLSPALYRNAEQK